MKKLIVALLFATTATTSLLAGELATLTWTDNSSNESGFTIERSTDGTNFEVLASVGEDVTTYEDHTVVAGTVYFYRVQAFNFTGTSDYSNTASFGVVNGKYYVPFTTEDTPGQLTGKQTLTITTTINNTTN
jgi:hypothetical protein